MTRKLAIWLAWNNFSQYHSEQLAAALKPEYETTVTYKPLNWSQFDVVMPFFPGPNRNPDCPREKIVKFVWEPHEDGWARDAGIVCGASTHVFERIGPIYKERARLLPWGVNPQHFFPQPFPPATELLGIPKNPFDPQPFWQSERLRVGWCGQYTIPRKQYAKLEELVQSIPGVDFCPNKTDMVKGEQTGDYTLETMHQYYASIHVYVCASSSEGFGFPLLEATACGRPVVTFDVGCARDLQLTGAGVGIAENWEGIKGAILDLQDGKRDVYDMGSFSVRAAAKHWTWPALRERWLEVLDGAG